MPKMSFLRSTNLVLIIYLPNKIIGKPFCEFSSIQHPLIQAEIELFANKFFVESHQG